MNWFNLSMSLESIFCWIEELVGSAASNLLVSRELFFSTSTISKITDLLNKLKSNLPFAKDNEVNTSTEHKIIIIKRMLN